MEGRSQHFREVRSKVGCSLFIAVILGGLTAGAAVDNPMAGFIIGFFVVYSWMITYFLFDP